MLVRCLWLPMHGRQQDRSPHTAEWVTDVVDAHLSPTLQWIVTYQGEPSAFMACADPGQELTMQDICAAAAHGLGCRGHEHACQLAGIYALMAPHVNPVCNAQAVDA